MAEYKYEGVDRTGKSVSGMLNAASEGDLRILLRKQGVRPTKIIREGAGAFNLGMLFNAGAGMTFSELLIFSRQLQVLIGSGIPLVQALDVLGDQGSSRGYRTVCSKIKSKVSEGSYLWESMAMFPNTFDKLYLALVRAGESSGALDQMLRRISNYIEDADRLRKMLKSAMMYPFIVIFIGIGVVTAMLVFVIPKFESLLASSGQELPGPTKFVIDMSKFLTENGMLLTVGIGVVGFIMWKVLSSPEGKIARHRLFFRMPIFGPIMKKGGTARFCRTLSTLLSSGVNLLDAIDICRQTINNAVLEDAVARVRPSIEQGKSLAASFNMLDIFPNMAIQMMLVGENTGQLDRMMEKVADFYEAEVEQAIAGLTKLIEPIILVFLGGAVGGILIAMYLPIFKLAGGVG